MGWRHDWYWPPTEGHIQPEDEATMLQTLHKLHTIRMLSPPPDTSLSDPHILRLPLNT